MRHTYKHVSFCASYSRNSDDFRFYESYPVLKEWKLGDSWPKELSPITSPEAVSPIISSEGLSPIAAPEDWPENSGNEDEDEGNEDEGNEDEGNEDEGNEDEGNEDEGNEDEGNKDEVNDCIYHNGLIICIGRDELLGVPSSHNRVHVLGRGRETIFTIRSFSDDDPSSTHFPATIGGIEMDSSSSRNWEKARECLKVCQKDHSRCKSRDSLTRPSEYKPTRLIDVGQRNDRHARLVHSKELSVEDAASGYIALSYCWGGDNEYKTTTINLETRCNQGLVPEVQPATIQQAISATRELGFRFLWIDGLCIVQDDATDKMAEIPQMHLIYQHADLLISASRAAFAKDGFLQPIEPETVELDEIEFSIPFHYRYQGEKGRVVLEKWFESRADLDREPIHSRGWTLQEHLLPKRILSFHTTGMSWRCLCDSMFGSWKKSMHDNCVQLVTRGKDSLSEDFYQYSPRQEWEMVRFWYSQRSLTELSDRLLAFSAIPRQLQFTFGSTDDYIAGHWRAHLPTDLLWQNKLFVRDRFSPFPTWSWASCSFTKSRLDHVMDNDHLTMNLPYFNETYMKLKMKVKDVDVDLINPSDPFGDVRRAGLLVSSSILSVKLKFGREYDEDGYVSNVYAESVEYLVPDPWKAYKPRLECHFDGFLYHLDNARSIPHFNSAIKYKLAEVFRNEDDGKSYGLILDRTSKKNEFTRLGTYRMRDISYEESRESDSLDSNSGDSYGEKSEIETKRGRRTKFLYRACKRRKYWLV
ncbi:heterokaryon incompatibility protein-domain-containing protein [Xylaria curta]|nr:heterokaryon incompatibility protein-domain-containing protein [Xylaria curta]